ncbi:VOC family protein [Patulibacter minatonensis]|uniref:VOC family protein n=1 Tax=Patulibacter minatonensis TaxID=298163 RepID=UPI00047A36CA|nr:VOC family protein [Patulibacter minatonensis]
MSSFPTGHVGLNVTDLDRSRDFYVDVFGFEVAQESSDPERRFAFLADDGRLALTLWQQSTGTFAADGPGLHHLSFEVQDIEQVREAEARVRAAEARVRAAGAKLHHDGIVPHGEGVSSGGIFFEDPDGTRLEIYAPRGADAEAQAPDAAVPTCGFF